MEASNMKAMREALQSCLDTICRIVWIDDPVYDKNGHYLGANYAAISRDKARAALAAPPRNCDVGTAKEQARRWEEFCTHHHKKMIGNKIPVGPCECPCYEGNSCNHFIWAQMPYNESEATYD